MADPAAINHPEFARMPIAKKRIVGLRRSASVAVAISPLVIIQGNLTLAQPEGVFGYEAVDIGMGGEKLDEFARIIGDLGGGFAQAAVWINGEIYELPTPDGYQWAYERGISPTTGIIVGGTYEPKKPIIWTIGRMQTLENLPGGECSISSVNDAGWAVGSCSGANRAALWKRTAIPIDLGDLGGGRAYAVDVNQKNEILGTSYRIPPPLGTSLPVLWRGAEMIDLLKNVPGKVVRRPAGAINNNSEILSTSPRGYYFYEGNTLEIPNVYGCTGSLDSYEINDAGLIVGRASDRTCSEFRATIWERVTPLGDPAPDFNSYTVDEFLFRQPDIKLTNSHDINNAGQIAAFGELPGGEERGFLVTPYQFELSEPAPGVAGERNTITVTNLEPDQRVILVFGTKEGAQPIGNGCLGGLVLIRDASTHKSLEAFADNSGVATFNVFVPKSTAGKTVRYQAVAPDECEISHTVEFTF